MKASRANLENCTVPSEEARLVHLGLAYRERDAMISEDPVPNVRIAMEDGTVITTDQLGKRLISLVDYNFLFHFMITVFFMPFDLVTSFVFF